MPTTTFLAEHRQTIESISITYNEGEPEVKTHFQPVDPPIEVEEGDTIIFSWEGPEIGDPIVLTMPPPFVTLTVQLPYNWLCGACLNHFESREITYLCPDCISEGRYC